MTRRKVPETYVCPHCKGKCDGCDYCDDTGRVTPERLRLWQRIISNQRAVERGGK